MTFERADLAKVAKLARLSLTEDEKTHLYTDLGRIVDFVDQLKEVDVENVKPVSHAGDRAISLRDDEVKPVIGRQNFSSSAGYTEGLVEIPRIIE